ncbi:RluA family pseudouridine synthase [Rhodospirillaceae bacterium KN72]|uniref:Pseudouridine synthase n=1 Tax=Pacificispira spongiicola TaxID=2729598 RepID=A0A7Y0DWX8_9PROT|nr:RluA family pseudouridine synthase [Pacificispira spongiicola]NMM43139.1 RluA family pseudouridine synthase [Pacificispira spongiicola]
MKFTPTDRNPGADSPLPDPDDDFDGAEDGNDGDFETIEADATPEDDGKRLDRFLADRIDTLSRSRIQALLKDGHVRTAEGRTVSEASGRVKQGTVYLVDLPPPEPALPEAQDIPLSVVYEDAHLIVVDKPAGMVVHPAPGNRDGTLVNALLHHCGGSLQGIGGVLRPGIVHRIDKDTSGLLVAAKTDKAHAGLSELFHEHDIDRRYLAVVIGVPDPVRGTIDENIGRHPTDRIRFTVVGPHSGKHAVTHYTTLSQTDMSVALIECRLETGRTHQIRVHMSHIGHPLVGDPLYGKASRTRRAALTKPFREAVDAFPRQALHAGVLGFRHPVTGQDLHFVSPPPPDFDGLMSQLGLKKP